MISKYYSNNLIRFSTPLVLLCILISCTSQTKDTDETPKQDVEFVTDYGSIVIRLYDETPQHRDNFLKLVNTGFYDSILFHRVIENFMIQAGDPDSRKSMVSDTLGDSDLPYTVPAEFSTNIFHKRGALGAARDGNPARASSSTQFYIVQGRIYTDSLLIVQEERINKWLAMNRVVNDSANQKLIERRKELYENDMADSARLITEQLDVLAEIDLKNNERYVIPEAHREVYRTVGGAAHLDQNYTVFGEVVKGMDVVDKIAATNTNDLDRPLEDIKIISARLIKRGDD
ncbi:MAG: peptidylprolyl isomerase [Cyclobacteriaceae bacterium]